MNNIENFNKIKSLANDYIKDFLHNPNNSRFVNSRYNPQRIIDNIEKIERFISIFDNELNETYKPGHFIDFNQVLNRVESKEKAKEPGNRNFKSVSEVILNRLDKKTSQENNEILAMIADKIKPMLSDQNYKNDASWFLSEIANISGNDLERASENIIEKIDEYGLNAIYSDDADVRGKESREAKIRRELYNQVSDMFVSHKSDEENKNSSDHSINEYKEIPTIHELDMAKVNDIQIFLGLCKKIGEIADNKKKMWHDTFSTYQYILQGVFSFDKDVMLSKMEEAKTDATKSIEIYMKDEKLSGLSVLEKVHPLIVDAISKNNVENNLSL